MEELQHNSKDEDSAKEVCKESEGEPTKAPSKPKSVQPHIEAMLMEISEVTKDDTIHLSQPQLISLIDQKRIL